MESDEFEPGQNPYEVTAAAISSLEPSAAVTSPTPRARVFELLIWMLLLPAILSHSVFWGVMFIPSAVFSPQALNTEIPFTVAMGLVPTVGLVYGVVLGWYFYYHSNIKSTFLHPVAQAIFQPFWFFVMFAGGCICAIPIVLMSM